MRTTATLLAAALVVLGAACSRPQEQPKSEASTGASKPAALQPTQHEATAGQRGETPGQKVDRATDEAKQTASDAALTAKVKSALVNDAGLKTLTIDIDSNAGVVRLKGMVDNADTKQRVHEVAQSVPGVKWVQNQLSIAPRSG